MKKNLTCIVCPLGCLLEVEQEGSEVVSVEGNGCKRGRDYAVTECTNPRRVITTTVRTQEGYIIPVKTDKAIPKSMIFECMKDINLLCPDNQNGYTVGDIICRNISGTDANVVVCADVRKV